MRPLWQTLQIGRGRVWVGLAASLLLASLVPHTAKAAPTLVQSKTNSNTQSTSISASFSPAAQAGHLLIAACAGGNGAAAITPPSGFSTAINESISDPSQGIFYKVAAGGETNLTCTFGSTVNAAIQIYEYSGMHTYQPFEGANTLTSTGSSGTTLASGLVTTTHANDLLFAAVVSDAGTSIGSWSNSFTLLNNFGQGSGKPAYRAYFGAASLPVNAAGTYSTTASTSNSSAWRGQIAAFRAMAASPEVSVDIVDGSGNPVSTPSTALSTLTSSFTCQTTTGMLAASPQRIRVNNTTDNPAWTLAIAATGGPNSSWSSGSKSYSYNNPASGGCTGGQLSISAASASLAGQASCPTSGVSQGSNAAFSKGVTDAITLATGAAPAPVDCYFDLSNIPLSQKVPPGTPFGSYTLNLTVTATSS